MKLKNLLLTGLAALSLSTAKAEDVRVITSSELSDTLKNEIVVDTTPQDTTNNEVVNPFTVTSAYAGQLTALSSSIDDLGKMETFSSTRVGAGVKYNITNALSLNTWGIVDYSPSGAFALGQLYLKGNPTENISVLLGNQATPSTLLRPFPVSGLGHFETSTDALIPGGANGVRIDGKVPVSANMGDAALNGSAGVASRDGNAEYGLNLGYSHVQSEDLTNTVNLAGWYQNSDVFGVVLSGNYRALSGTLVYNETVGQSRVGHKLAYAFTLPGKTGILLPYFVQNWDLEAQDNRMMNSELGLLGIGEATLGKVPVDIIVGPGYDMINKNIVGYVQVSVAL